MLNNLPDKKKGDKPPGAGHINTLNKAAREILNPPTVGYGMGGYGGGSANFPPWQQRLMRIVSEDYPLGQALYLKRVYEIRPMFYSENDEDRDLSSDSSNQVDIKDDWEEDEDATIGFLDASVVGRGFALD